MYYWGVQFISAVFPLSSSACFSIYFMHNMDFFFCRQIRDYCMFSFFFLQISFYLFIFALFLHETGWGLESESAFTCHLIFNYWGLISCVWMKQTPQFPQGVLTMCWRKSGVVCACKERSVPRSNLRMSAQVHMLVAGRQWSGWVGGEPLALTAALYLDMTTAALTVVGFKSHYTVNNLSIYQRKDWVSFKYMW